MHSFCVGVQSHVAWAYEVIKNFIVASDHPASIQKVEVGYSMVDL